MHRTRLQDTYSRERDKVTDAKSMKIMNLQVVLGGRKISNQNYTTSQYTCTDLQEGMH